MNRSYKGRSGKTSYSIPTNGARRRFGGSRIVFVVVALGIIIGIGVGIIALTNSDGIGITPNVTDTGSRNENSELLNRDTFYNGVFVDEIPLGGLTKAEAKQQIEEKQKTYAASTGVTITHGTQSWMYYLTDIAYTFDTDEIIEQAYGLGRDGTDEERLAVINQLQIAPVKLMTTVTADPSTLEQKLAAVAEPFTVEAVDAAYVNYDLTKPEGERLTFTPDAPGSQVDIAALWAAVKKEFTDKTFGTVEMKMAPVEANVKLIDLQGNMQLITRFSSTMKDHSAPRMTNITIASTVINGLFVLPGETFSFNDATGERTADKGYKVAHVINGGVTDNGLAGGICQVSGTLWNAVVRADLEIVERYAHSLKSAYLPMGQDATVDYGHYDLKFKNNKETPVLLIMYIGTGKDKYKLFAEIYGTPLADGMTIELYTKKTGTVPARDTISYAPSEAVSPGTTETIAPREGVKATTYKLYMKDDTEMDRVELHKDYYKESGTVIVYNPIDGVPTASPSASPSATIDPAATATSASVATPTIEPTATPAA